MLDVFKKFVLPDGDLVPGSWAKVIVPKKCSHAPVWNPHFDVVNNQNHLDVVNVEWSEFVKEGSLALVIGEYFPYYSGKSKWKTVLVFIDMTHSNPSNSMDTRSTSNENVNSRMNSNFKIKAMLKDDLKKIM